MPPPRPQPGGPAFAWASLWAPVIAYLVGIFVVSSLERPPGVPGALGDKSLHALAYAGLAALLVRALSGGRWARVTIRVAAAAALLATLYGLTDEWHQSFVPGRTSEGRDVLADAFGATAGVLACYLVARARVRRAGR